MTTQSIHLAPGRTLPLVAIAPIAVSFALLIHFADALLTSPNQLWFSATVFATAAMIATTTWVFHARPRWLKLVLVFSQQLLLAAAPLLGWLYSQSDPGGLGVVREGLHRSYSGMPLHVDLPLSVLLGMAPLHLLSLARAVDPLPRRRWLQVSFYLAGLTALSLGTAMALDACRVPTAAMTVSYIAVLGVSLTRLSAVATGLVLFGSLLRRRGPGLEALFALPVTFLLTATLIVGPSYRFHVSNLGYRPLSVALLVVSGLALGLLYAARAGRWSFPGTAYARRHLRRLAEEQMAAERDDLAGATNAQNT